MPNLKIRQLEDENGDAFSPITYANSIFNNDGTPIDGFATEAEIGDQFDPDASYVKGAYCIYENEAYRFTSAKSAGAWDSTKVTKVKLANELATTNQSLAELISYSNVIIGNVTIGTGGYTDIKSYLPTKSGYTLLFVQVMDYGQGKGALSVDVLGRYISGAPSQTWTNVVLRYFFIKNFA